MLSRRAFVKISGLWVLASCSTKPRASGAVAPTEVPPPPSSSPPPTPIAGCQTTEDNIEGPYYRAGAPLRSELAAPEVPGTRIAIGGRVWAAGCATPIDGAILDVWQADRDGRYDNDHHDAASNGRGPLRLRGKIAAAKDGAYEIRSILPGRYLNGPQYRPAHVHVKVTAPGYQPLTTQLYFEGDPYNAVDGFIKRSLVMTLADRGGVKTAAFDFVLQRA